jgi:hypothetical protein
MVNIPVDLIDFATEGTEVCGEDFSLNQDRLSAEWCDDTDIVRRKLCFLTV